MKRKKESMDEERRENAMRREREERKGRWRIKGEREESKRQE